MISNWIFLNSIFKFTLEIYIINFKFSPFSFMQALKNLFSKKEPQNTNPEI